MSLVLIKLSFVDTYISLFFIKNFDDLLYVYISCTSTYPNIEYIKRQTLSFEILDGNFWMHVKKKYKRFFIFDLRIFFKKLKPCKSNYTYIYMYACIIYSLLNACKTYYQSFDFIEAFSFLFLDGNTLYTFTWFSLLLIFIPLACMQTTHLSLIILT